MNSVFRFQEFNVYKQARQFRIKVKTLSKEKFPREERFCLTSQLWRALDSILLNIAEGSVKYSEIDFRRFLNIALGSLNEVVACLDAALDDEDIFIELYEELVKEAESIAKQVRAFSGKLGKKAI